MRTISAFTGASSSWTMSSARSSTSHSPAGEGAGQGAFGHVGQLAQRRLHHDLVVHLAQGRRREHAMADEIGDEARGRPVVQRVRVVPLVQPAFVHHADHVADGEGLELVVRDEQRRGVRRLEDAADLVRQPLAQVDVEVGERLVQQQQLRLAAPARAPAPRVAAGRRTARAESAARCRPGPPAPAPRPRALPRSRAWAAGRCRRRRCGRRRGAGTARSPGTPCRCAALPPARARRRLPTTLAGRCASRRRSPAPAPRRRAARSSCRSPRGRSARRCRRRASPNETSSTAGWGRPGVLDAQLGDLDEHGAIVDAYNSHLHQPGLPRLRAHAPCAGFKTLSCCCWPRCWSCRCSPCWRPGCNGTRPSAQVLGEMARTVLPGYVVDQPGAVRRRRRRAWRWSAAATAAAVTLFDFPGPPQLRMGLAAAAGHAGLCRGLCLHRLPAVQRPVADAGCAPSFGLQGRVFPEVRSLGGAAWVFIFSLYPYVYLLARTALSERAGHLMEAARLLGAPLRAPHPPGRAAAGAPGRRGRRRAGPDGNAGRLRRVQLLRHPDLHHRHLQGLAGHGQPHRRGAAGDAAAGRGGRAAGAGAPGAAAPALRSRAARRAGSADAQPCRCAAGRLLLAWTVCGLPVLLGFVLPVLFMLRPLAADWSVLPWDRFVAMGVQQRPAGRHQRGAGGGDRACCWPSACGGRPTRSRAAWCSSRRWAMRCRAR